MSTPPTYYSTAAVQNLLQKLEEEKISSREIPSRGSVSANEPRFFIPNDHIQKYFESGKNEYSRAEELLHAVFNTSHIGIQALPVHPQDVTQDCCKVFCILIRIGRGEYIPQFVKYADTIGDAKLPFSRNQCPEKFPIADFYDKFVDEQWKFCAPQIKSRANLHIDADLVLPFHVCEHIQGPVHKVIIHKNHDQLVSKNRVHLLANPQLYDGAEILQAKRNDSNTYAVKVFRSSRDEVSQKKESSAFEYITKGGTRSTPGLIGFHGGFTYGDSFNLILEYAEGGTLADLLQKSADLHEGQEIFDFWSAIFETFKGLQAIHEQHIRLERGQSTEAKAVILKGWHQDLKPENILLVKNTSGSGYRWCFKIADFGLSHFKAILERGQEADDLSTFGTRTCGAPECYQESNFGQFRDVYVTTSVDIWSLACILAFICTWIARGPVGVKDFSDARRKATDSLRDFRDGDCFHDGLAPLKVVIEWLRGLRPDLPSQDYVSGRVLDLIKDMLKQDPSKRPLAQNLEGRAESIIDDAEHDLRQLVTTPNNPSPMTQQAPTRPPLGLNPPNSDPGPQGALDNSHGFSSSPLEFSGESRSIRGSAASSDPAQYPLNIATNSSNHVPTPSKSSTTPDPRHSHQSSLGESALSFQPAPLVMNAQMSGGGSGGRSFEHTQKQPWMTYADAWAWYRDMKATASMKNAVLPHHYLTKELEERDHVIVIDDSATMNHVKTKRMGGGRPNLKELALVIAYIVKQYDRNGVDLRFLRSEEQLDNKKSADEIVAKIAATRFEGMTNITACLNKLLLEYGQRIDDWISGKRNMLGQRSKKPKCTTFYIFTDGVWQASQGKQGDYGQNAIISLVDKLVKNGLPREQVGIQFISFGDDQGGQERLRKLDQLKKRLNLKLDIVDTERFDGDIWKMLLGAINSTWDDDTPEASPLASPVSPERISALIQSG